MSELSDVDTPEGFKKISILPEPIKDKYLKPVANKENQDTFIIGSSRKCVPIKILP